MFLICCRLMSAELVCSVTRFDSDSSYNLTWPTILDQDYKNYFSEYVKNILTNVEAMVALAFFFFFFQVIIMPTLLEVTLNVSLTHSKPQCEVWHFSCWICMFGEITYINLANNRIAVLYFWMLSSAVRKTGIYKIGNFMLNLFFFFFLF